MFQILSKTELAQGTVVANEIHAPRIAAKHQPGQFVIIRPNETGERIPLTLADVNKDKGTITIIYQVVGKTTAMMKNMGVMDHLQDVCGPLGRPTPIEKKGTVICVGGGTGVAVLHPIAKGMKAAGNKVISIIGARTKNLLILQDEMASCSDEFHICTDDGSFGHHGFVTDVLKEKCQTLGAEIKEAVCIGPVPMMKFCSSTTKEFGIPTMVSLNAIMVDGTGMCGCCRVSVGGEIKFACVDGPEFDAHKVDFEGLSKRLVAYTEFEARAMEDYRCACEAKA